MKLTFLISPELTRRLKIASAMTDRTHRDIATAGLEKELAEIERQQAEKTEAIAS